MGSKRIENTPLGRFRLVALLEGISFLLLLGVAMPLKYIWEQPLAVRYVGWAHGLLFILYFFLLVPLAIEQSWPWKKTAWASIAAFLPFGTFVLEKQLQREKPQE
ncbi:MAG: DUF3817 domain-containing protein [Thermonemataceae bacterium]|mgnify:CR=1 FL=1